MEAIGSDSQAHASEGHREGLTFGMQHSPLVSAEWLYDQLNDPNLVILDATLAKPKASISDIQNSDLQIKGARYFDIDDRFSDASISLPHMMCGEEQFEKEARSLGIHKDSTVLIYDQHGVYSSPRAWWMLRSMGHEDVYVLNGGLPEWVERGYPTESKGFSSSTGNFEATFSGSCFVNSNFVLDHLEDSNVIVLDARSKGRFDGTEPEPREGMRGGHIPNSLSLPFTEVLDGIHMKTEQELKSILEPLQLDGRRLVFSCGSGLTACIILLAAYVAGYSDLSVYDGSWSQWGQPGELPVVT